MKYNCALIRCKRKAVRWLQMGKLGELPMETTPCIALCQFHANKVLKWGFKE